MSEQTRKDIEYILENCTGVGNMYDELALIRISLRAYADGASAEDAVSWACEQLSNSISKI